MARDPSERRTLSEAQYRDLFQNIHEGFFVGEIVRDAMGRAVDFVFLEVNRAFTRRTGIRADEAVGRPVSDAIPGFPSSVVASYGKVVDTGETATFELEVPALADRWYEARVYALDGDRFMVLLLEITERKSIERALQNSRTLLSNIIEFVDQMVWSTRPDGYHDFFNGRWYEYTGAAVGSTDGDEWALLFHPEDRERTFTRWRRSLATGEPYEIEYRLRHRSGEYRWVLGRAHAVRNQAGEIIRWMGTCTDIHEQKSLAEKLELASRELSHRIKNIFAVMSGLIGLSARQHPEATTYAEELRERIMALARAHEYARPQGKDATSGDKVATVLGLVGQLLRSYQLEGRERIVIEGYDAPLNERAATPRLACHPRACDKCGQVWRLQRAGRASPGSRRAL